MAQVEGVTFLIGMDRSPDLRGIDLNLLVVLDVLLAEQSISKASRRLGCGQPAVSKKLATLRSVFADPLLVRQGRNMYPTPRARALAKPLADSLNALRESIARDTTFDPSAARGTVRVGFAFPGLPAVPRLVESIAERAPGINVHFLRVSPKGFPQSLAEGTVDVVLQVVSAKGTTGLRRGGHVDQISQEGLHTRGLWTEGWCCVVSKSHPKIKGSISLKQYVSTPHVLVSVEGDAYGFVDAALARVGKSRRIAVLVQDFAEACMVTARSSYILTTNPSTALVMREIVPLSVLPAPIEVAGLGYMRLVWHERTHHDRMHRWFRETLHEAGQEIAALLGQSGL